MAKSGKKTYRPSQQRRARPIGPLTLIVGGSLLLVGVVVFVIFSRNAASSAPPPGFQPQAQGPRVSVDRETIDLGRRPLDVPVEAVFYVTNVGSTELRIEGEPQVEVAKGC